MKKRPAAGRRSDERGGRQMIFDDGDVDCAPPEEPSDRQGLAEISADRRLRHGRDLDALEGVLHVRTDNKACAPIAALENKIAHAELDRRCKTRPEMRVAQHDVGDLRLTHHR